MIKPPPAVSAEQKPGDRFGNKKAVTPSGKDKQEKRFMEKLFKLPGGRLFPVVMLFVLFSVPLGKLVIVLILCLICIYGSSD